MKALVIYSHTYSETSKAGNAILEVLKATPNFEVRNIDALYPDLNKIDIAAEQKALLEAEVIIFQHPILWFNVPHSLKRWMGEDTYAGELGQVLSAPILATANCCGMEYVKAFPLYGQLALTNPNVAQEAKAHAEKLVAFVQSL